MAASLAPSLNAARIASRAGGREKRRRSGIAIVSGKRELAKHEDGAHCQVCGIGPLLRTLEVLDRMAGHVAHNRGRRVAPADRYNPDAALLKCRDCHLAIDHSMRFA